MGTIADGELLAQGRRSLRWTLRSSRRGRAGIASLETAGGTRLSRPWDRPAVLALATRRPDALGRHDDRRYCRGREIFAGAGRPGSPLHLHTGGAVSPTRTAQSTGGGSSLTTPGETAGRRPEHQPTRGRGRACETPARAAVECREPRTGRGCDGGTRRRRPTQLPAVILCPVKNGNRTPHWRSPPASLTTRSGRWREPEPRGRSGDVLVHRHHRLGMVACEERDLFRLVRT
jgi:hypothetical protein